MTPHSNRWKQLAAAAKPHHSEEETAAPYGFSTRTIARWKEIRRQDRCLLWERYSLRAGIASLVLCSLCLLGDVIIPSSEDETLIPVPTIDLSLS